MKKKGVTLTIGVVCMGCLFGAYAYLKSYNAKNQAAEEEEANKPILNLDIENPASLRFDIGGSSVEFAYAEDTWTKTDDETFPVNEDTIKTLLTDIAAVSAVRTLEEVEDISGYGFEEPQNILVYTDVEGNTTTLTIGANNESTGDDYLLVENGEEQTIYTISTTLRSSISDDINEYAVAETETEPETEIDTE